MKPLFNYFFLVQLLLCNTYLLAQNGTGIFTGTVIDASGNPIVGATVALINSERGAVTNVNGVFTIKEIKPGNYALEASSVGFVKQEVEVVLSAGETIHKDFSLKESFEQLSEVTITSGAMEEEMKVQPITISSLDTKVLQAQSLGAEEILKQTSGVVVRQIGGLGSNVNINLNGLTGNSVRLYYDGIPLEVFGGGIQINNIPVDALQRMDVYKGVMPIEIGTDALGGGINLVPSKPNKDYLRTSYSFGSFNTHRFTLGAGKKINEKLYLAAFGYINHSDNDFTMRDIRNTFERVNANGFTVTDEEIIDARRFHDRHYSSFVEFSADFSTLSWADDLKFAISYSDRHDQIQNGQFLLPTAIGEVERSIETFSQRIDYRKLLFNRLNIRYFGVFSNTTQINRDSTQNIYNWRGEILALGTNQSGSEIFGLPTARKGNDLGTAHRLAANYMIGKNLTFTVSDYYRYTKIDGNDPIGNRIQLDEKTIDPNTIPSKLWRNIFGAELTADFLEEKITVISFYKNYFYKAESIDITQEAATFIPTRNINENIHGFGLALKYKLSPSIMIRSSFERAARIPTQTEIFGDFAAILPNYTLKPEQSDNINLGFQFNPQIASFEKISFQVDAFIRNRENLIRIAPFGPENSRFVNEAEVDGKGIEASFTVVPNAKLSFNGNFTYQSNIIRSPQLNGAALEGAQVPNIPQLFYNAGIKYRFENLLKKDFGLELFSNYFFMDRYSINEVKDLDSANPAFVIPSQHLVNLGFVVSPNIEGLNLSFTLRNALNSLIYDNFRIPRPGINYSIKINYAF